MFNIVDTESDQDLNHSTFLITLNSQKAFTDKDKGLRYAKRMRQVLESIYSNFDRFLLPYRKTGKNMVPIKAKPADLIMDGSAEIQLECGTRLHRLHSHSIIKTSQASDIYFRVNLPKLRSTLIKSFHSNIHLDVKFLRDHEMNMKKYIHKSYKKYVSN